MSYTKLHSSIIHSTIWQSPKHVKILWITMLAMTDQHGEVMASVPGLAKAADITVEECEDGLAYLARPDKYSRTPDNEGRRIEEVKGGWAVLNHDAYRKLQSIEDRREKDALRQRRRREKNRDIPSPVTDERDASRDVTDVTTSDQIRSKQNRTKENTTTNTPAGRGKGRQRKLDDALLEVPDVTPDDVSTGRQVIGFWPKQDPEDSRKITADPRKVVMRLVAIRTRQPLFSLEVLLEASRAYATTPRRRYKSPEHFLSLEPDPATGKPPFYEFAAAEVSRQKLASAQPPSETTPPLIPTEETPA